MRQILLYTLSNLFDSINLINTLKLICLKLSANVIGQQGKFLILDISGKPETSVNLR